MKTELDILLYFSSKDFWNNLCGGITCSKSDLQESDCPLGSDCCLQDKEKTQRVIENKLMLYRFNLINENRN